MVTRPYGDLTVVKQYVSNVKISDTTIQKVIDRIATKIEAKFHLNGAEFDATYVYLNTIKNYVELKSACQIHLMYGKREDAKLYCDLAKEELEDLIEDDITLETETEGEIVPLTLETYPANPLGHKLEGRSITNIGDIPT